MELVVRVRVRTSPTEPHQIEGSVFTLTAFRDAINRCNKERKAYRVLEVTVPGLLPEQNFNRYIDCTAKNWRLLDQVLLPAVMSCSSST